MANTIEISSISILPYCPSSRIATEFPAIDAFSARTQFIPFGKQSHLAVLLEAVNKEYGNPRRRTVRKTFFLNVRDVTERCVVASRTHCFVMERDELRVMDRVDIPFRRSQLNPEHDYRVEVTIPGQEDVVIYKPLHYITAQKLPTSYYNPVTVYVKSFVADSEDAAAELHLSAIDADETCGRSVEFELINEVPHLRHRPELFMRFYSGDDVWSTEPCSLHAYMENEREVVKASCDIPSLLNIREHLYVEILSMGYPIAAALIDASGCDEEGELCGDEIKCIKQYTHCKGARSLETRRNQRDGWGDGVPDMDGEAKEPSVLDSLVGLEGVKSKLESYRKLMEFYRLRRKSGLPVPSTPLHCMFLGSPGTGKTTVAKEIGRLLHECGALSSGHVVVRERATLIGQFYNSEAEKTLKALEEAKGGILFIDEAYQLHQPEDPKDPGRFVLETLMTALSDTDNRDWMLILAGYTEPMLKMFSLNPGLASRIPEINFYHFDDFSEPELMEIAERYLSARKFDLTCDGRESLARRLAADYANRGKDFGNARHVVNLIETEVLPAMAARIASIRRPSRSDLSEIKASDIPAPRFIEAPRSRRIGFAS